MQQKCTGVILAGGKNSRLPGKKKGFYKIGPKMIIDKIYEELVTIVDEIIIVVNDPKAFSNWNAFIVSDIIPTRCALAGVHAGIFYASFDRVFITACDTPFIRKDMVEYIISCADKNHDIIVPQTDDGYEALSAVYSKACLPLIEKSLNSGSYMIKSFWSKNRVKKIPVEKLKEIDPQMETFFNVNTQEDLEKAKIMLENYKIKE